MHDKNCFKVGYVNNITDRLRQLRCSAPYTQVVKRWPCRGLWEKTAIEYVTDGCESVLALNAVVFPAANYVSG